MLLFVGLLLFHNITIHVYGKLKNQRTVQIVSIFSVLLYKKKMSDPLGRHYIFRCLFLFCRRAGAKHTFSTFQADIFMKRCKYYSCNQLHQIRFNCNVLFMFCKIMQRLAGWLTNLEKCNHHFPLEIKSFCRYVVITDLFIPSTVRILYILT